MRVLLNDVIVASAEKVVVAVRKLEGLVSKAFQGILKAQEEALEKYVTLLRAKAYQRRQEARIEAKEILKNAQVKAERIDVEATDAFYEALKKRCAVIDKKHDLIQKRVKGL